jgi:hypothetical protein
MDTIGLDAVLVQEDLAGALGDGDDAVGTGEDLNFETTQAGYLRGRQVGADGSVRHLVGRQAVDLEGESGTNGMGRAGGQSSGAKVAGEDHVRAAPRYLEGERCCKTGEVASLPDARELGQDASGGIGRDTEDGKAQETQTRVGGQAVLGEDIGCVAWG